MIHGLIWLALGVMVWLGSAGMSAAAEWAAEPRLSVKGEFNSNLLLTGRPHKSVYGLWTSPELNLRRTSERTNLIGHAHLDVVKYVNNKNLDMIQQFYNATVRHRMELHEFGLTGNYSRDSVLLGELVQTGVVGQVNLVGRRRFRKRQSLQPTWNYQIAERWASSVNYNFTNVTYDVPPGSGFLDFRTHSGGVRLSHNLFENTEVYASGQVISFAARDVANSSLSYGGESGGTYNWTERLKVSVFGGGRFVKTTLASRGITQKTDRTVGVFGGTVNYQWEDYQGNLSASRSLNPSALGLLTKTDRVAVTLSGDVTEKVMVAFTGSVINNTTIANNQVLIPKTRFFSLQPSLQWRWHEQWGLKATYQYRHLEQKGQGPNVVADSQSVTLMLSYVYPRLAVSE